MVRTKTYLATLERHAREVRALQQFHSDERERLLDRIMVLADKPPMVDFGPSKDLEPDDNFVSDAYLEDLIDA